MQQMKTRWTGPKRDNALVLSYRAQRLLVGLIGLLLPLVLIFGKLVLDSPGLLPTISDYYHSAMRDWLVGGLCAIGVFLLSYRFTLLDDLLGDIAGVAAIGVALFPNTPDQGNTGLLGNLGQVHYIASVVFLVTLAVFAVFRFPHDDAYYAPPDPNPRTAGAQKRWRKVVYWCCGGIIIACLVLIWVFSHLAGFAWLEAYHPYLWLESGAVWAFGIAWLVKGV